MNQLPAVEEQTNLVRHRKRLHYAAIACVRSWGYIPLDDLVKNAKAVFVWLEYKKETSRALSQEALIEASKRIKNFKEITYLNYLEEKKVNFNANDYKRRTQNQRNKIIRIMVYVIGLKWEAQLKYIAESIGRSARVDDLTINEANQLIVRLEKWECKILLKK